MPEIFDQLQCLACFYNTGCKWEKKSVQEWWWTAFLSTEIWGKNLRSSKVQDDWNGSLQVYMMLKPLQGRESNGTICIVKQSEHIIELPLKLATHITQLFSSYGVVQYCFWITWNVLALTLTLLSIAINVLMLMVEGKWGKKTDNSDPATIWTKPTAHI